MKEVSNLIEICFTPLCIRLLYQMHLLVIGKTVDEVVVTFYAFGFHTDYALANVASSFQTKRDLLGLDLDKIPSLKKHRRPVSKYDIFQYPAFFRYCQYFNKEFTDMLIRK